jgi:beta-phosphoglucomutase-like phosphatase (HAD superfamily)
MLLQARRKVSGIEFERAAVVGDSACDIAAGRRVGALTVWITDEESTGLSDAHHIVPSLERAVQYLLSGGPVGPAGLGAPQR